MITGAAIGFLVWAGILLYAMFSEQARQSDIDWLVVSVLLFALTGSGAAIGRLVS